MREGFTLVHTCRARFAMFLISIVHQSRALMILKKLRIISPSPIIRLAKIITPMSTFNESKKALNKTHFLFTSDKHFKQSLSLRSSLMPKKARNELNYWVDLLKSSQVEQFEFLKGQITGGRPGDPVKITSNITGDGVIMNSASGSKWLVYLVSFESIIDMVYIPSMNLVMTNRKKSRIDPLQNNPRTSLFSLLDSQLDDFIQAWNGTGPKKIGQVFRQSRIMHHVEQEVVGALHLHNNYGLDRLFILRGAGLFSREVYLNLGFDSSNVDSLVTFDDLKAYSREHLIFYGFWPSTKRGKVNPSWEKIKDACLKAEKRSEFVARGKIGVFMSITSGEKRSFVDEVESLVAIIHWSKRRWGNNSFFVFDGWTMNDHPNEKQRQVIGIQQNMLNQIVAISGLTSKEFLSLIGKKGESKVAAANGCVAYISSGSPVVWPSMLAGIPGVVHGSSGSLKHWQINSVGDESKTKFVDAKEVKTLESEKAETRPWHFMDYSIRPSHVRDCFEQVVEQLTDW